ncbi:prepilin-type N-terminal cleavage/methylation domain-containing protein [Pelomonas sp. SE-A7]|uniref:prepilin-type N-terminal cleavage/methylation domain-containing protein n=1 Tax=Pelomonas sp. SE-A7 TaxID=3054953 RepID=UPI00259C76DA|nr:prepilin-type N-terminal cleavage/methylation domain-containing protein [Pelomonas sp. SE-A7]MDM4767791.1 prepilin-type N-terminal cleavage/methylation domain-containing protein [Pelomonas sp. SE-A7]
MNSQPHRPRPDLGFTLVEMVITIVILSVVAVALSLFLKPALETYFTSSSRAALADDADTALRRLLRDVRSAVPNSIRIPSNQCVEMVPTTAGGRVRMGPDTVNDFPPGCSPGTACSAPLSPTQATTAIDLLTPLSSTPAIGDFLVIGNQNANDVYGGVNRAAITGVLPISPSQGKHRLTIASTQFPPGFDSGRFSIVSNAEKAVFYVCSGGSLWRLSNYGFNAGYPASCPSTAGGRKVASGLTSCSFVYDPNPGASPQFGYLWVQLELSRNGESATIAGGAHVVNAP